TATVYQKGSEVIRMMHTILGEDGFQKGMRLYVDGVLVGSNAYSGGLAGNREDSSTPTLQTRVSAQHSRLIGFSLGV
ncbi:MAG: hypothetical protein HC767_01530, partial [Akkermansiaceae bacterium]|nr:hypothetical protein [Akkermansiaceae bacterium]